MIGYYNSTLKDSESFGYLDDTNQDQTVCFVQSNHHLHHLQEHYINLLPDNKILDKLKQIADNNLKSI